MSRRRTTTGEPIVPPTPERLARGEVVRDGKHMRVRYSTQLEKLVGMGKISEEEYKAGCCLWVDFRMAGLDPRMSVDIARHLAGGSGGTTDPAGERQLHHLQRYRAALRYLNYSYRDIVLSVCCLDLSLTEYTAKYEELKKGFACFKLREALGELARFYKGEFNRELV